MDTVGIVALAACAIFGSLFLAVAGRLAGLRPHSLRLAESIRNISVGSFHQVVTDGRRFLLRTKQLPFHVGFLSQPLGKHR